MPRTITRVSVWTGRARLGTVNFHGLVINLPAGATQRPFDQKGERIPFSFELSPPGFLSDESALHVADEVFLNHVQGSTPEGHKWRVDWPRAGRTAEELVRDVGGGNPAPETLSRLTAFQQSAPPTGPRLSNLPFYPLGPLYGFPPYRTALRAGT
jgi:hypothetical protein